MTINVGGRIWIVDDVKLLSWLQQNAVQKDTQLKQLVDDRQHFESGDTRVLLNETA